MIQNSSDVTLLFDREGSITYQSPAIERVLGYPRADGADPSELFHPDDRARAAAWIGELMEGRPAPPIELRAQHADGTWRTVEAVGRNALDDPDISGVVVNFRDVTERTALEEQLRYQAFHDPLTKLANRALFADRLEHALARRGVQAGAVAVLFLDLDDFKGINESLGHSAGDGVLIAVAERLRATVRAADTVARFGGDEFAILLEDGTDVQEAVRTAERVLRALRQPFESAPRRLTLGASLGIALSTDAYQVADDLLRNADVAMYRAKSLGKGRYELFDPSMHSAVMERLELKSELGGALPRREFRLHYQPIVELSSGRVVGAEALLRWAHPERGLIPPAVFIPLAEESDLIVSIGRWVLRDACRQAARWQERLPDRQLGVSVNLSARQLRHVALLDEVSDALADSGLVPERLTLEITESLLIDDPEGAIGTLGALKELGVRIAIDDFGTGYSSLSYLARYPIDTLKIDKSFVDTLAAGAEGSAVARLIVELADTLRLDLVAEGIERAEQVEVLRALGCPFGQGYHFARPVEPRLLLPLLEGPLLPAAQNGPPIARCNASAAPRPRRREPRTGTLSS